MEKAAIGKRVAATVVTLVVSIYVNQGHFNWVPSPVLFLLFVAAGLYWVSYIPYIREKTSALFRRPSQPSQTAEEPDGPIFAAISDDQPSSGANPVRAIVGALCILTVSIAVGLFFWWDRPNMRAEIIGSMSGEPVEIQPGSGITFHIHLFNIGPPSITNDWRLSLKLRDGEVVNGVEATGRVSGTIGEGAMERQFFDLGRDKFVDDMTKERPVQTGQMIDGAITFIFPGIPRERLYDADTNLTLTFRDASRTLYATKYVMPLQVNYVVGR